MADFLCGPYLLAPRRDGMTIAWEASAPCRAWAALAREGEAFGPYRTVPPVPDAPRFRGRPMALFRWTLEGLEPDCAYRYRVRLESGAALAADFRTLPECPRQLRFLTLSDSHAFSTRPQFQEAVRTFRPHGILHCGDLVEGTGAQAEQFAFFLRGQGPEDFLHHVPVLYAQGNHDSGGPYWDAYIGAVQDAQYRAEVRGDWSADFGGLHLCVLNSGPWGLGEMNAASAGRPPDPETRREAAAALDWLRRDLAAAGGADFRLLLLHHPFSDPWTARALAPVTQAGRVDLVLSGHTHAYARAFSGPTLCVTQQDARMPSPKGNFCLLEADLAAGLLTLTPQGTAAPSVLAAEGPALTWEAVDFAPAAVLCGDAVTVRATVRNQGRGLAAAELPVEDGGTLRTLRPSGGAPLEPGQAVRLEASLPMERLGARRLSLGGASAVVEVRFRPACFACGRPEVLQEGSRVRVRAAVRNIGCTNGTEAIPLCVNGRAIRFQTLSLEAGGAGEVQYAFRFEEAGDWRLTVGDSPARTVSVQGGIQGMPLVRERSGQGYASIHGAPRRGFDAQGRRTLLLDGLRDYLEFPDDGRLRADGGVTGMVWARLPSAGTTRPGVAERTAAYAGSAVLPDHNPLLVKGPGLGWGTTYQFRMAVRDSGRVAYGVCFADDNGEFSWNDGEAFGIQKDVWVQYTAAFDRETGGDAWENGLRSAHVDPPPFDAPVQNWPGVPLRVGLGFKNALRQGRGRYHTMLPGEISQVRYYTRKLTEAENARLLADPEASLPDGLQVHLRFEDADLLLDGSHTTEWVPCRSAAASLTYTAEIPPGAAAAVRVQWSPDAAAVCREDRADLRDGRHSLSFRGPPSGWVRLRTDFRSLLGESASAVPVLREYRLEAGAVFRWNTLDRWLEGAFSGAAGHQDSSVYRDFPE